MKKIVATTAALFILLTVVTAMPQNAYAAPDGMVVVYVSVPDDWKFPCIWAWDDGGNGVFDSWPGGEMDPDPDNAGWYYIYMPNWANNIIVNANNGEIQTDALVTEGKNVWITVESPDNADVSFDKLTSGDAPDYVERITVHARVPDGWSAPGLWAWLDPDGTNAFDSWPGGEMRLIGDWFAVRAPNWINSIIINANEGSVQTEDFKGLDTGKDLWVVVADDSSAEIFYENPDMMVPNITVRTVVPAGWENPHLWAWSHPDGTNAFASWPGEAFTLNGDWYEISLPGWVNSFIVNANDGSIQTGDMSELDIGVDIWIIVEDDENYSFYYSEPEVPSGTVEPPPPVAETPASPPEPEPEQQTPEPVKENDKDNTVLWIILSVVGVGIIVAIVLVVIKKRKK